MRQLVVYLALCGLFSFCVAEGYHGFRLYEVTPNSETQNAILHKLAINEDDYDFLHISGRVDEPAKVIVNAASVLEFEQKMAANQFEYKMLSNNIAEEIDREFELNKLLRSQKPYSKGEARLSTERYYTHDEINQFIEDLAAKYNQNVFIKRVGKTFEGRWLKTITITNGDGRRNKNVIYMDGGFHAREWISPAAVIYAIEQLVTVFVNEKLLVDYDWVILPVVNADGYQYTQQSSSTRMWRKTRKPSNETCIGTDPNRNFDFHWKEEGASDDPCSNTFAGPYAFSEPEAVVVRDIIRSYADRGVMYLTVHSHGQLLLYPWGWGEALPDNWQDQHEVAQAGADAIFNETGTVYTVGSSTTVLYAAAGASDDYAHYSGFTLSYTMELPAGGANNFDPPPEDIDRIVKETWIGIRAMAEKAMEKYPLKN